MKKILYALTAFILIITSCKKENIQLPDLPGKKPNALSGTSWKTISSTSVIHYNGLTIEYDLFSSMLPCQKDNVSTFLADGTTMSDEGPLRCNANDPQTSVNGNWTLSSDQKKLVFSTTVPNVVGLTLLNCEVLQLDSSTLKLRYTTYYNGPETVITTTYTKVNKS